jgi:hypothetical protein
MGIRQASVTCPRSAGGGARSLTGQVAGRCSGCEGGVTWSGESNPGSYTDLSNTSSC